MPPGQRAEGDGLACGTGARYVAFMPVKDPRPTVLHEDLSVMEIVVLDRLRNAERFQLLLRALRSSG